MRGSDMMLAVFLECLATCPENAETPRTQRRRELSECWIIRQRENLLRKQEVDWFVTQIPTDYSD